MASVSIPTNGLCNPWGAEPIAAPLAHTGIGDGGSPGSGNQLQWRDLARQVPIDAVLSGARDGARKLPN